MEKSYQTVLRIIVILAVMMIVLKFCLIFLWPLMAACFLVLLLEPGIRFCINLGCSRKQGTLITYLLILLAPVSCGWLLSKMILNNLSNFQENIIQIGNIFVQKFSFLPLEWTEIKNITNYAYKWLISIRSELISTMASTLGGIVDLFMILVCAILVSLEFDAYGKFLLQHLPSSFVVISERIYTKINKLITLELLLVLFATLTTMLGLSVLGINNALTIGLICGILDLLPVIGTAIIFFPLAVFEFSMNRPIIGAGLLLLFLLLQVCRELLKIKLVGKGLELHPLVTVLCLYYGLYLYGAPGLVLGPALAVVILELCCEHVGRSRLT